MLLMTVVLALAASARVVCGSLITVVSLYVILRVCTAICSLMVVFVMVVVVVWGRGEGGCVCLRPLLSLL
jgi:hypothetical protein